MTRLLRLTHTVTPVHTTDRLLLRIAILPALITTCDIPVPRSAHPSCTCLLPSVWAYPLKRGLSARRSRSAHWSRSARPRTCVTDWGGRRVKLDLVRMAASLPSCAAPSEAWSVGASVAVGAPADLPNSESHQPGGLLCDCGSTGRGQEGCVSQASSNARRHTRPATRLP